MKEFDFDANESHKTYWRFQQWISKTYGKDLVETEFMDVGGKKVKITYLNEFELSQRLIGYEVQERVMKYVKRYCPEIKVIRCDDHTFSSSIILLIPHPKMGITVIMIPQNTNIQNQFFLYYSHWKELTRALRELESSYKGSIDYEFDTKN